MQKVELLTAMGLDVVFAHWQDGFRCFNLMQLSAVVLFYRVPGGSPYFEYVDEAKRLGLKIGYDIDDPIYDRSIYSNNVNLDYLSKAERAELLAGTSHYAAAMSAADFLVTSTTFMQEHMAHRFRGKTVHRLQNFLDAESLACEKNIRRSTPSIEDQGRVVVTYASGSRAHEADFRVVEHALHEVMKAHDSVVLHVLGHLNLPACFDELSDRVHVFPLTSHCGYLELLYVTDVVIVPLVANRFNECKSAIRYLEAGLLGKAAVLSRVGEFREAVTPHVNGVLCDAGEWRKELDRVITDPEYRRGLGKEAHRNVMMNYRKEAMLSRFDAGLKFWLMDEEAA
jgi:glycosyltransferase involved in cell wall biosynthesis